MLRMTSLSFLALCVISAQVALGDENASLLRISMDLVRIDSELLDVFGRAELQSESVLFLTQDEVFMINVIVRGNNGDDRVIARPKTLFTPGHIVTVSNGTFDDVVKMGITQRLAWKHTAPFTFKMTPQLSTGNTVSLRLSWTESGHKQWREIRNISDGASVAVVIDCSADGRYTIALLTPQIVITE